MQNDSPYCKAKIWDIEQKLSKYDQMGYLIYLKRPNVTYSSLSQLVMTYIDPATQLKQKSNIIFKLNYYWKVQLYFIVTTKGLKWVLQNIEILDITFWKQKH